MDGKDLFVLAFVVFVVANFVAFGWYYRRRDRRDRERLNRSGKK